MTSTLKRPAARKKTAKARPDNYQLVTDQIVAALEAGVVPWHRPWSLLSRPTSLTSGKPYRGINFFMLGYTADAKGYDSKWWGTFNQIKERAVAQARSEGREIVTTNSHGLTYWEVIDGERQLFRGGVRKGEKSTSIVFWRLLDKKDENGEVTGKVPLLNYYNVFNADQADGLPDLDEGRLLHDHDPIEDCEAIRDSYLSRAFGLELKHGGDRAVYNSMFDTVTMPVFNSFDTAEHYYGTLFHEFAHSTGHESRLKREKSFGNPFGSPDYSKEELIAEMTAAFVCGEAGIEVNVPDHAAYIANWLQVFKGDKKLLVSAGGAAQKAADLILGPQEAEETEDE